MERLPMNTISSLIARAPSSFSKEDWLLHHAPRLAMLKRVLCLSFALVKPFAQMLAEDVPPGGPLRLPLLTKVILYKISLTALRTYRLRDILLKCKEQGAPLETLDLRTCVASGHAIQLLAEVVGNVKGPATTRERGRRALFDWRGGVTFFNELEELTHDDEYIDDGSSGDEDVWDDYDDESDSYDDL
jgi:hypothetical protein